MKRHDENRRTEGVLLVAALAVALGAILLVYLARMGAEPVGAVDLNRAPAESLADMLHVGAETAQVIVAYRERIGGFENCEQLLAIPAPSATKPAPGARRAPLLDSSATRPLLPQFIVRTPQSVRNRFWGEVALFALAALILPPWLRARGVKGDPYLVPLSLMLCGLGAAMLFSIKDPLRDTAVAGHHLNGVFVSLAALAVCCLLPPTARLRIKSYQYLWVIGAFGLVMALMVFGSGPEGVKLNLLHFQPVELIKLFLVFYLAGSLADRADLIADLTPKNPKLAAGLRPIANLLPRQQDIGPLALMFFCALSLFYIIKDMGPGLILFATFISMIFMLTGRSRFVAAGLTLALLGGWIGYWRHIGVFATRVDMWLHPFANSHPNGMQLGEGIWAMASGAWQGSGLGLGMPGLIPRSGSDLAFASWAEETGFIGSLLVLCVLTIIVWRGVRITLAATSSFDRALAAGLTSLLALQTLLILAGVLGLFPLSGIALPFLSYGNSAMLSAFVIIGLLRGISSTSAQQPLTEPPRAEVTRACRVCAGSFAFMMLGVFGLWRLGTVQVLRADEYATRPVLTPDADHITRPHINPRLLAMAAGIERGSIYDRNGAVLATSRESELKSYFTDEGTAARMAAEHRRYYPFGPATANLVGYLDGAVGGPFGMERTFNSEMRGFARYADLLADFRRRNSPGFHARRGLDLHLTIDARLQRTALEILVQTAARQRDRESGRTKDRGGFVLMDPSTGDVLASVTTPTFDPNSLTPEKMRAYTGGTDSQLEHRLVDRSRNGFYPPGSTLKIATAASALETLPNAVNFTVTSNHVASPIRWQAGGKWYTRRHVREDEADPAFGALTMGSALRVSSNIYFANLAAAIGSTALRAMLANRLGFSHVPDPASFNADLPDIGYGQGRMLASPLEMCRLAACVANDGEICAPRFVASLTMPGESEARDLPDDPIDRPKVLPESAPTAAMSRQTAQTLQEMMRVVVTQGTARNIFNDMPFTVAGKTGSAQNHQFDGKAHSWFIGFAPASYQAPPRYAFACCVENSGYGRAPAAPVCRDVLKHLR